MLDPQLDKHFTDSWSRPHQEELSKLNEFNSLSPPPSHSGVLHFLRVKPMEIYMDDETKLTLHGLVQHYIKLTELEKNRKLNNLLDALDFNQVVIFVKSVNRVAELNKLLVECNFPAICTGMSQEESCFHVLIPGSSICCWSRRGLKWI